MDWIEECTEKCKKIKYIDTDFEWGEKPNRSGYLVASSGLLDNDLNRIKDLYLTGEHRELSRGRGTVFSVALQFYWQPGELRRVFMIESYPDFMLSHRDNVVGMIYGPHLHLGDPRLGQVVKDLRSPGESVPFTYWVKKFVRHARVYSNEGVEPIEGPHPEPVTRDLFN